MIRRNKSQAQVAEPYLNDAEGKLKLAATAGWYGLVFLFLYFYFWKYIRPELYFTAQEPVFYFDRWFLRGFLFYPAGILDAFTAFFGNLNYQPWLGALALSLLLTATVALFRAYLNVLAPQMPLFLPSLLLIPYILFFSRYAFSPLIPASVLAALFVLRIHTAVKSMRARALFAFVAGAVLYYCCGNALYLYALAAVLYEISRKNVLPIPILILLCLGLPMVSGSRLFTISPSFAFRYPLFHHDEEHAVPLLLYAVWAVIVLSAFMGRQIWKMNFFRKPIAQAVQIVLLLAAAAVAAFSSMQSETRQFWLFTYYGRMGQWDKILKLCEKPYIKNQQVILEINRALAHTGRLGERMFYYRQPFGREGLFVLHDQDVSTLLIRSDIYFDVGHYNAARQWAHEAASVRGETVWNVQRLALCYLILGQTSAAELYFRRLETSLFHRRWAKQFRPYWCGEKNLSSDQNLAAAAANCVKEDFITFVLYPEQDFPHLLKQNPDNRAALDYMFADLLLSKKLKNFVDELVARRMLNRRLPRHYQEALLFYVSQVRDLPEELKVFKPDREVLEEFGKFQAMVRSRSGNLRAAEAAFEKELGHTYWFYLVFHKLEKES